MPTTRTPGITVDVAGDRIIDKEHRGIRIYVRLGPLSHDDAEHRLDAEIARMESHLLRKANARPRFADAAARYSRNHALTERSTLRSGTFAC